MVTAAVTGKVKDFTNNPLSGHPVLFFTPERPAIDENGIYVDKAVRVQDFGNVGQFTVNLVVGIVRYRISVLYLNSATEPVGYTEFPNPFTVPPEGGDLSTIAVATVDSNAIALGPNITADSSDGIFAGLKANTTTGDLFVRRLKTNA